MMRLTMLVIALTMSAFRVQPSSPNARRSRNRTK